MAKIQPLRYRLQGMACKLCSLPLPKSPIEKVYCCHGCALVDKIVSVEPNPSLYDEARKAGLLSQTIEEPQKHRSTEKKALYFQIEQMWCPACSEALTLLLQRQRGVIKASVDYATDFASIEYDPRLTDREDLFAYIKKIGYLPSPLLDKPKRARSLWVRFAFSLFALLNLMMFAYPLYFSHSLEGYESLLAWLSLGLATPLLTYAAFPFWRRFFLSLRTLRFGMESLILLGMSGAYICSLVHIAHGETRTLYFDSMAMVLVSVLLGKILEKEAKFSAKERLLRTTRLLPQRGRRNGVFVPLKEIKAGDCLTAFLGEKIVLDGEVISGEALVDEAVMSGEAHLILKKRGKSVVGGSVVKQGELTYRVNADLNTTLLSKVIAHVERDLAHPSPFRSVDRFIPLFVPIALILGFASGHLLEVLLIACPCAIGIAVPLAESRLIKRFAELGVMIRNRSALFLLGRHARFVFDKTGTLTEGCFTVLSGMERLTGEERTLLGRMASTSTHPLCFPLAQGEPLEGVEEIPGRGLRYRDALLGSKRFLEEQGVDTPHIESAQTLVYFAQRGVCRTVFEVGDRIRPLPPLKGLLLSGDREEVVAGVARKLGLEWKSSCDPLEKREEIVKMKGKRPVVMVGDGVNDAAALAVADVGISVTSGSALALHVADLIVSDVQRLPQLIALSKRGLSICRQNLFWAFAFNTVGMALACMGQLTPLIAAGAMSLSSITVVLSSLRLEKKTQ